MSQRKSFKSHFKIKESDLEEDVGVEEDETEEEQQTKKPTVRKALYRVLNKSDVSMRLSGLGKIGTGDGYTYLKATITSMGLTDIRAIANFVHLQYVDFSDNNLTIENLQPVTKLPYLLFLRADKNFLKSAALKRVKYLQVIVMNKNSILECNDVFQENLSTLELGHNKIEAVHFDTPMPSLKCLDFRYNRIKDLINWDFPNLHSLYLAGNSIKKLEGIESLTNLRILHLRDNPLSKLDYFGDDMKIIYLNLRNCKIKSFRQVKKLKILPALRTLILKGTPYMGGTGKEGDEGEEYEDLRVPILAAMPKLERINKKPIDDEERAEAKELIMQQLEEGEKVEEESEEEAEEIVEEGEKE